MHTHYKRQCSEIKIRQQQQQQQQLQQLNRYALQPPRWLHFRFNCEKGEGEWERLDGDSSPAAACAQQRRINELIVPPDISNILDLWFLISCKIIDNDCTGAASLDYDYVHIYRFCCGICDTARKYATFYFFGIIQLCRETT